MIKEQANDGKGSFSIGGEQNEQLLTVFSPAVLLPSLAASSASAFFAASAPLATDYLFSISFFSCSRFSWNWQLAGKPS